MPVDYQHPEYQEMAEKWKRCRDTAEGQDSVKSYIPQLKDQISTDYKAYQDRACFYNATWRTIAGMNGMLFRKPPVIDVSETLKPLLTDVTLSGISLDVLAQELGEQCLTVSRAGLLVDYPNQSTEGMTAADAEKLNLRPSMQLYEAESIINWKETSINNRRVLSMVVLSECFEVPKDEFESEEEQRFRVLDLLDGVYRQRLFKVEKKKDVLLSEHFPTMNGKKLDYIPFIFINSEDLTPDVEEPNLIDLVDLNLSHYRVSADYEHGCHFTGLPTAVISGYTKSNDNEKLYIGSTSAWVFPDPQAKASFLEFTGQGLTALENNLKNKEQQMAILGARLLTTEKKGIESADTANIHRAGESSILAKTAQTLSEGLTRALVIFSEWAGMGDKASIEINRDFSAVNITTQDAVNFMALVQGGAMSQESAFLNMKKGGLYEDSDTFEIEQARIDAMPPTAPTMPTAP